MPALSRARLGAAGTLAALLAAATVATATGRLWVVDRSVLDAVGAAPHGISAWGWSLVALTASGLGSTVWCLGLLALATDRRRALSVALGVVAVTVVELALKLAVDHPGPPGSTRNTLPLTPDLGRGGSFPSGHMARAVVLAAGTVAVAVPRRLRTAGLVAAGGYTAAVAWTRLDLHEHWASDVIGGVLLGAVVAAVAVMPPRAVARAAAR